MSDEKLVLKPCPRCKGEYVKPEYYLHRAIAINCRDCNYTGLVAFTEKTAIELWNDEDREGR